ncbi:hypothetical protein [Paraburkholderia sacchari]|uniref:Uncharacterized protein n=1 Tax=Paraburkholderia sacchari TaxID=159450 RepID=A0A8T6Z7H6_9BURK|nr:hypothetical protein [Paraburkholderia sacchari]NLP60210.1 hypothetical protein [Paraburkholderia sacchari]
MALHAATTTVNFCDDVKKEGNKERTRFSATRPGCFTMFTRQMMNSGGKVVHADGQSRLQEARVARSAKTKPLACFEATGDIKPITDILVNYDS